MITALYGTYLFGATSLVPTPGKTDFSVEVHTWIRQYRDVDPSKEGQELIFEEYNAGVLTTVGKNFIEGKLGDDAFANNTAFAEYLSMSTDNSAPSSAWVNIPSEQDANGLSRQEGGYTSTGDGVYEIEYEFTATGQVVDIQLLANSWDNTKDDGSLFFSDTCTPFTVENQDTITLTAEVTIT